MSDLLNYLEGTGTDHRGRTLEFLLEQDDEYWERNHDFIQWLFPSSQKSMAVPNSPVIRPAEINAIRESEVALENLKRGTLRFIQFLSNETRWRGVYDHNQLRISRVIKTLRMLLGDTEADQFKNWVVETLGRNYENINQKTRQFWELS